MNIETNTASRASATLECLKRALSGVIKGKDDVIELLLLGLITRGHILIEDVPGVGKTTLAKALARVLAIDISRVQFTPDLLPADILGTQVLNTEDGSVSFQRGPVFTNLLLADEINRASPRTQSALLEAMSEQQVTIDGVSYRLPTPFMVLATQNPVDSQGTYPLPEAQLDRFVLRLRLGYPGTESELEMLFSQQVSHPVDALKPITNANELEALQHWVREVRVSEPVARYILALVAGTRAHDNLELGASPRGALLLFRASQGQALIQGRDYVIPDDVQRVAVPVLAHRIMLSARAKYGGSAQEDVVRHVVENTAVPA
jgi:MoxR-like ATPase